MAGHTVMMMMVMMVRRRMLEEDDGNPTFIDPSLQCTRHLAY